MEEADDPPVSGSSDIYAAKHKNKLVKQVEEDCQSRDLFLSGEEFSEECQSQFRLSNGECDESSSEPSQKTQESQASTDTHSEEDRPCLVFEQQLIQLLQYCLKCGSLIMQEDVKELQNEGSQLTLKLSCTNGCSYRWQSQPTLSGTKVAENLLLTASLFFSVILFAKC